MKKHLTKFLFLVAMVVGLSMSAMAQSQDKKKDKKPPRREPPEIRVPKERPKPPKKDRKKDKKPPAFAKFISNKVNSDLS